MFVRKKKNRSGTISVVVVDKSRGKFREVKKFGVGSTEVALLTILFRVALMLMLLVLTTSPCMLGLTAMHTARLLQSKL